LAVRCTAAPAAVDFFIVGRQPFADEFFETKSVSAAIFLDVFAIVVTLARQPGAP